MKNFSFVGQFFCNWHSLFFGIYLISGISILGISNEWDLDDKMMWVKPAMGFVMILVALLTGWFIIVECRLDLLKETKADRLIIEKAFKLKELAGKINFVYVKPIVILCLLAFVIYYYVKI